MVAGNTSQQALQVWHSKMSNRRKVVVRIRGGIGNQLFCYATGYAVARNNDAELVVDHVSGFTQDVKYKRVYRLNNFNITARTCKPYERLEPFSKIRRHLAINWARKQPYSERRYLREEVSDFDPRLRGYTVHDAVYLDGYWQSYLYFREQRSQLCDEFKLSIAVSPRVQQLASDINACNAVAVHFRCFDNHKQEHKYQSVESCYYCDALQTILRLTAYPHFFVFSDDLAQAQDHFIHLGLEATFVDTAREQDSDLIDLWLMTQCRSYIIANSTFSWWAAWLSQSNNKIVIAPGLESTGVGAWGFDGLIPDSWIVI